MCGVMGRLPAEIRALTPLETFEMVEAWNAANAGDQVDAPTSEEFEDLVAKYG